jgi:hypothetical protein
VHCACPIRTRSAAHARCANSRSPQSGRVGGVTAHSVTIHNYHEAATTPQPEMPRDPGFAATVRDDLRKHTFFEGDSYLIERTASVDSEGRANEFVYWHYGPSAWLRVIPANRKELRRAQLPRLVTSGPAVLTSFGAAGQQRVFSNVLGASVLGFDAERPDTIASRLTQVLLNGEIWGMNREVVEMALRLQRRGNSASAGQRCNTSLTRRSPITSHLRAWFIRARR